MAPSKLPTRHLGTDGPQVTALGFGLMGLSAFYGSTESDEDRFKVLDRAYELGALNWDSADIYGDNEDFIGKWFKKNPDKRSDIFLATKFANQRNPDGTRSVRNEPEYIREACEKSLKRLGIDTIDLYYCHRFSGKVPVEDVIETMAELKKQGKIRHLGVSEVSSETLRRAHAIHPISAVQIEYSPWALDIETPDIDLLKTCRELGVAVIAYSPLGRGFLTGQYRSRDDFEPNDFRLGAPRFSEENFPKNLALVDKIKAIADKKGVTPGQLTLAWLMRQGEDVIPIPGTKKIKYLEENMGALKVELSDKEDGEIRKTVEEAEITGGRYPEAMSAALFADTPKRK
ncbi:MAG: hypothetical protein MMC23_008774 [Stictis urceolatum]|nr:hypothetical protein [Stictis urceolata]